MDCFTEIELINLFENEIISRILICRDLVLSPFGIHPDILALIEFLKKGRYLEKLDEDFTHTVIKLFLKIYKFSAIPERLCFWITQLAHIADWINQEYGVGTKIEAYGLDLSSPNSELSNIPVNKFWEKLYFIITKFYRKILKSIYTTLTPLCHKISIEDNNLNTIDDILNHFTRYFIAFTKNGVYDILIMQFFHQIYRYIDTVMFNSLLYKDNLTGQVGVNINLAISQLEEWKFENLKQSYPNRQSISVLPFTEIAPLIYISEGSKLVVLDKAIFTDLKFLKKQFKSLNYNHIYTLLMKCVPDDFCPSEIPKEVLKELKKQINNDKVKLEENRIYSVLNSK